MNTPFYAVAQRRPSPSPEPWPQPRRAIRSPPPYGRPYNPVTPDPSQTLQDDLTPARPLFKPVDSEMVDDLLRLDGVASCYHPGRGKTVPMVFCVWAESPTVGNHSWQHLECVPPAAIAEYMRRCSIAALWLESLVIQDETEDGSLGGWITIPSQARTEDIAHIAFPSSADYTQGNVPDRPEVPNKRFTPTEIYVADNTLRRYTQHYRYRVLPEWKPLQ